MDKSEKEKLANAMGWLGVGYIFLYIDINIGSFELLPNWAFYIFAYLALPELGRSERSALLLQPLTGLLFAWECLCWGCTALGVAPGGGAWYLPQLLAGVLGLYYHFQLLTNAADAARSFHCEKAGQLIVLRNISTVLTTLVALPWPLERMDASAQEAIAIVIAAVAVVLSVWSIIAIFAVRGELLGGRWGSDECPE